MIEPIESLEQYDHDEALADGRSYSNIVVS